MAYSNLPPRQERISVQRLYLDIHFDEILKYNKSNINEWSGVYPNHLQWIKKAVGELKGNDYERIAFGGFYIDEKNLSEVLCASVLVKKNPFTPYLEIKNLICFNYPKNQDIHGLDLIYKDQIIKHIRGYAEQRGFPKLVTELVNKDRKDKQLIKLFLENDFVIAGNQYNRYKDNDDIVYLVSEVNTMYGFDPYDNSSLTKWILSRYLNCDNIAKSKSDYALLFDYENFEEQADQKSFYSFSIGKGYEDRLRSKFNSYGRAIVLEEYLTKTRGISQLSSIKYADTFQEKSFIFDFTKHNIAKSVKDHIVFNKSDISDLAELVELRDYQNRFPYEKAGGFLLISNKLKFPSKTLREYLKKGITPIYIKLGSVGKYVTLDMPLFFAYYPYKSHKSTLKIWGIARLCSDPDTHDLKELLSLTDIQTEQDERVSHGDFLFEEISDHQNAPLWDVETFDRHNSYNATNTVVCFYLDHLTLFEQDQEIDLSHYLDDNTYLDELERIFDFYLSKLEVERLLKQAEATKTKRNNQTMTHISIPQSFRVEVEQQLISEYMKLARFRKLKSDQVDYEKRSEYQLEIDNCFSNIKELKEEFLNEVLLIDTMFSRDEVKSEFERIHDSIKKIHFDLGLSIIELSEKADKSKEMIQHIIMSIDNEEISASNQLQSLADSFTTEIERLILKHKIDADLVLDDQYAKASSSGKLKLAIPVIPGILAYETDLINFGRGEIIRNWKDLAKIFKKSKD